MTSKIHGLCQKCKKRKTCKAPCAPIEHYLKRENLTVYEKHQPDGTTILYPRSREAHQSTLSDKGKESHRETNAFSTEAGNPFTGISTNNIQTSVFIKRFFGKWEYKDIAKAHDTTVKNVRGTYHNAVKRVLSIIIEMDTVSKMSPEERKRENVAKQKRYLERNRDKVNAARRARYAAKKK